MGKIIGTKTCFYVCTRKGVWVESDDVRTIEEARKEMDREYWKVREPVIVKRETVETIVEEGK